MKEIPLTKGQIAIIDDEDLELVIEQGRWRAFHDKPSNKFYACKNKLSNGKNITIQMHRLIMNTPKGMDCDHINGNTLDNRKQNLRNCTRSQNVVNSKVRNDNKLGLKCISYRKKDNAYVVQIRKNGKSVYVKLFKKLEDAIKSRDEQLKKYYGEFARTE